MSKEYGLSSGSVVGLNMDIPYSKHASDAARGTGKNGTKTVIKALRDIGL